MTRATIGGIPVLRLVVTLVLAASAAVMVMAQTPSLPSRSRPEDTPAIGVAEMRADGTIVLRLRATSAGGAVGHSTLEYPPSHPQYAEVLRHLGGMKPGEVKSVPPWPD